MRKYLTLSDMGNSGGLCSQLQIYAGMLAVAKSNNMEIAFSENMIKNKGVGIRIFDLLDLNWFVVIYQTYLPVMIYELKYFCLIMKN